MGRVGRFLHPNQAERHARAETEGQIAARNNNAEALRLRVIKQKLDDLQQIEANVAAAQQTAAAWHAGELSKAATVYADKVADYLSTAEQYQQEHKACLDSIIALHTSEVAKGKAEEVQALATMQTKHMELLHSYQQQVMAKQDSNLSMAEVHAALDTDLNNNYAEIHSVYIKAINPETERADKISLYSKLDAWFSDLYDDNKINMSQQQKYLRFLLAASFTNIDLSADNAMIVHQDILELLKSQQQDQVNDLQNCYENSICNIISVEELEKHLQHRTEQLAKKYAKEFERLAALKVAQEQELIEHLNQALQTLAEEKQNLEASYAKYCKELEQHYDKQLQEIEQQKSELSAAVEAQQTYHLGIIESRLAADLAAINNQLENNLKALKRESRGMLINLATVAVSLGGASFIGPLLAEIGASATVIASVQGSLIATGAGSLKNLLNGKDDRVGITINMSFIPNNNSGSTANQQPFVPAINNQNQSQFDLAAFKEKYAEKTKKILAAQAKTEHKLRYNLTKPVVLLSGQGQPGADQHGLLQPPQARFKSQHVRTKQSSAVVKMGGNNGYGFAGKYVTYNANGIQAVGLQQSNGDYKFLLRNTAREDTSYSFMLSGAAMDKLKASYLGRTKNTQAQATSAVAVRSPAVGNFIPEYDGMPIENNDALKWIKFGIGVAEGAAVTDAIVLASRLIPGAPVAAVGLMALQAGQMAKDFNDHNFVATDDYDNIARLEAMGLLKTGITDNLWQERNARQLAARSEARLSIGQRFQENPAGFGFFVGTFFTFKGEAVAAGQGGRVLCSTPIRPRFFSGKKIEPIKCDKGLVYEAAPYHSSVGNAVKSKAPSDPKYTLENSIQVKSTSSQRISYDYNTKEIIVFMEHEPSVFHGHVRDWTDLTARHKNILKDNFGFSNRGKPPKL